MTESLAFARPLALAALALLPLFLWLRLRAERHRVVAFPPLQHRAPRATVRWPAALPALLEALLLAVVVVAVAGPYRQQQLELIEDEGIDVVLALDVSLSMLATDFEPNRLAALGELAREFVTRAGGHRIGIVIFAKDCFVQVPLTTNHRVLLELLGAVNSRIINQTASGGTAIGDALLLSAEHLRASRRENRDQAIVLITDGESNEGAEATLGARYVREQGIRLYAIGIGGEEPMEVWFNGERVGGDTPYLAVLDDRELQAIARTADGRYYRALDAGALERIFAELGRLESAPLEVRRVARRVPFGRHLALAALALFALTLTVAGVVLRSPFR